MAEIDELSVQLLEQAKRFLEKADESTGEGESAYCNAALLLGSCALEAHINAIADELTLRAGLGILDISILTEQEWTLEEGKFQIVGKLKMYRLEDRLNYILSNFTSNGLLSKQPWWSHLKAGLALRNRLVHPKGAVRVDKTAVGRMLSAIVDCLDTLYKGVYRRSYPARNRNLNSALGF